MKRGSEKNNIVVFWPNNDWGMYGRTYEKVSEHLAKLGDVDRVVCIFPPVTWKRLAVARPLSIRIKSSRLWLVNENRSRTRPHINAENASQGVYSWPTTLLRALLRQLGFKRENTIMWMFPPHPYLEELLEIVPHALVVTQVVDDFSKLESTFWLYDYAVAQYPRVTQFSDMVITSSQANFNAFNQGKSSCYLFENAVDESFIATPSPLPCRRGNTAPRLGYVGWITGRTDLSLLEHIARQRPAWSILIAGPQHGNPIEKSALPGLPNVQYLGPLPYKEVATFLQTLDVCLIPHHDTPYSKSMSPLKLYQYLASGRPIVSSNVAGLDRFKDYVYIADSYDCFIERVEQALDKETVELSGKRIELARKETWDRRVLDMFTVVQQQLNA